MKIYISTYHRELNYGAALQAFALQSFLKQLNYDSKLIDFENNSEKKDGLRINNIKSIINFIYGIITKRQILGCRKKFEGFFSAYHNVVKYKDYNELLNNFPSDGMYLSGSDQVFNPIAMLPWHFLQFGNENIKRISYAASVAVNNIPTEKEEIFKKYISSFDCISIRESMSAELVKKYTNKDVNINVDPVYLIEEKKWLDISKNAKIKSLKKPYILLYVLYRPKWLNKKIIELKKIMKCDIVVLSYGDFKFIQHDKCIIDAGPLEFIKLISEAKMVVSSSFHGSVFATIFRKPFYAVVNPNSSARIISMLKLFHLEERILEQDTKITADVDYSYFNNEIKNERKKSKEYLVSAIESDINEH